MTADELKQEILSALLLGQKSEHLFEVIVRFQQEGGSQDTALRTLEGLREGRMEEDEDRILEMMDCVAGWCQPKNKIWPDKKSE